MNIWGHVLLTTFPAWAVFQSEYIQEEAKSTGPKESEAEEQSVVVAQNGHFKPRQPRWNISFRNSNFFSSQILILGLQGLKIHTS